jgi:hypothetical protein
MKDSEFQRKLNRLHAANSKYKKLLFECEEEYFARFGCYPSDQDDDSWIDAFHVNELPLTVKEVTESALMGIKVRGE